MFGLFESKGIKRTLAVIALLASRVSGLGDYAEIAEEVAVLLGSVGIAHPLVLKAVEFLKKLQTGKKKKR